MQGFEKIYVGRLFSGYLKWGLLGAWMTFKKAEMAKTLRNGLNMIEMNPLSHNWSDFTILSGLTLHQFKKKLLLSRCIIERIREVIYFSYQNSCLNMSRILVKYAQNGPMF